MSDTWLDRDRREFFSRAVSARSLRQGPSHSFICDVVAHVPQGVVLKGHGAAAGAHAAFDQAADRIEKQLRRYKRRLKDRHAQSAHADAVAVAAGMDAGYTVFASAADEDEPADDHPPIVAETRVDIPSASVSDAVMLLDLGTPRAEFRNSGPRFQYGPTDEARTIGWVGRSRASGSGPRPPPLIPD